MDDYRQTEIIRVRTGLSYASLAAREAAKEARAQARKADRYADMAGNAVRRLEELGADEDTLAEARAEALDASRAAHNIHRRAP